MVESGTNVNDTPAITSATDKPGEKTKERLVGCSIVLDPNAAGMFVDESNNITLSFFKEGADIIEFRKEMEHLNILRNVKFGILRVMRDGKDVTEQFGGIAEAKDWRRTPVVEGAVKMVDEKKEVGLINLLNRNKEVEVIRDISSINDYAILVRLDELEKMGKNPSALGRPGVLDAISKQMKKTPGVSEPTKVLEESQDAVSVK